MTKLVKTSFNVVLDTFYLGVASTAVWGNAVAFGGAVLFWE
jgi:hypothetical protein